MKATEFTEKAMQMAREQEYKERNASPEQLDTHKPERRTYPVHLHLSDEDFTLLQRLLDLGVSKSREAITRAKRFPTDSNRSRETIERHEEILDHIDTLRRQINEECQW